MGGWIKICGLTTEEDIRVVLAAGADAIGLNLWAKSPRFLALERAKTLADMARGRAEIVIVTVDMPELDIEKAVEIVAPDWVQLHGAEPDARVAGLSVPAFIAIGLADEPDVLRAIQAPGDRLLIDARDDVLRGGTGRAPPDALAARVCEARDTVLAGGLNPDNVAQAVRRFGPWGVDVASGVEERPGVKSHRAVREFVQRAREAFGTAVSRSNDV